MPRLGAGGVGSVRWWDRGDPGERGHDLTLRRYRTIDIQAGDQIVTAEDPLSPEVTDLLDRIHHRR